jgi:two-component system, cell cycle sensor histidine kinase and response regulator CckA
LADYISKEQQLSIPAEAAINILNSLQEHVIYYDREMKILWANSAALDSVEISLEKIESKRCWSVWAQRETPCDDCPVILSMETGSPQYVEKITADGRSWLVKGSPLKDKQDNVIGGIETTLEITELAQAEEALRESEQRYRQLVDNARDIIYRTDADGRLTYINPTAVKMIGYPTEEAIGKHYLEVIQPNYHKDAEKFYGIQFVKKIPNTYYEFPAVTKDGQELWLGQNVQLIVEGDSIVGFQAVARDITDRKQAEDALKQSEERFRKVFEDGPLGMVMATFDDRFLKANDTFTQMLGYSAEDLDSLTIRDITHPDHIKNDLKELDRLIRNEIEVYKTEKRYIRKDKNTLWGATTVSVIRDENGKALFFLAMIEDITERKRAEEAHQQSEERYRSLVENTMDGYFICEIPSGRFLFLNQRSCEIYGYKAQEGLNLTVWDVMSTEDHERIRQRIQKRLEGENLSSEKQVYGGVRKDGSVFRAEISTSLVWFQGNPAVQGVLRDITEQELLEQQLHQAQKMKSIGTLAGGIAHDFNNLLMGIQGNASLMLLETDSRHSHHERLKNIEQYVKSGAELTKQLLGFAQGGKYEVKPINLNDLIDESSGMFGRTRKDIRIHKRRQQDLWIAKLDRGQIEQVLLNLYVNAWQAMPGGGDLFLETENVVIEEAYAKLFGFQPGKYVKISVMDTGFGMDEATQQRIFDPFFTTKERGRGTGLGLASAYGIIKNHEGFLNVHSKKGEGTTFTIYLPASGAEVMEEEEKSSSDLVAGEGTILLVDDQEMILNVGRQLLESLGYKVMVAGSGNEALEFYKENRVRIDLVILDMIMPDMGGGETYDKLKGMDPSVKVLLASGYSIDGQATEILERGCDGFIQKPFNITDLSQKLRKILNR